MQPWRRRLLIATLLGTAAGYLVLLYLTEPHIRVGLSLLTSTTILAGIVAMALQRNRLTENLLTANLALGSIVHLFVAGLFVVGHRLGSWGMIPTFERGWHYFLIGIFGVVVSVVTWRKSQARPKSKTLAITPGESFPEPAPETTQRLSQSPDFVALKEKFESRNDPVRVRQLLAFERTLHVLEDEDVADAERVQDAILVLRQEVMRVDVEATAAATLDEGDVLSTAAELFSWAVQKLPELAHMDVPDLLLAQCIADIRASHERVEHIFVEHSSLQPIHPINRDTAEEKCASRVAALQEAKELIRSNGMRLSEDFIAAHDELKVMQSVNGFQVVAVGEEGFVTFEGNGRAAALARAFDANEPVLVEVRHYCFSKAQIDRVRSQIQRVQRSNGTKP